MNGKYKGKTLKATNRYSSSLVYDDKISKGDEIFVELSQDGSSILGITGIILNIHFHRILATS